LFTSGSMSAGAAWSSASKIGTQSDSAPINCPRSARPLLAGLPYSARSVIQNPLYGAILRIVTTSEEILRHAAEDN
jgi:hypothetical protein